MLVADKCGKLRRIIRRLPPLSTDSARYAMHRRAVRRRQYYYYCRRRLVVIARAAEKSDVVCFITTRWCLWCGAEHRRSPLPCVPPLVAIPFGRPLVRPRRCFRVTMAAAVAVVGNNRAIAAHQQLYSGKINGTITGDRPFLFSHTLLCRRRRRRR